MSAADKGAGGKELFIADAAAMEEVGRRLAVVTPPGSRIYLQGDLGAGKTTLVRGFLRGRGYRDRVKSPTYTLVEPYEVGACSVIHIDLYRIRDGGELETLGMREYLDGDGICLVEWPERGSGRLVEPDILIEFRILESGRALNLSGVTVTGGTILAGLDDK